MCDSSEIESHMEVQDHSISKETFPIWKCLSCDFHFTQNPPTESDCGRYYESEDYISHSDKKEGLRDRLYHVARSYMLGRKERIVTKSLAADIKGRLLDVGSGTGYFLNHMQTSGWEVQGIEVSEKARQYCQKVFDIKAQPPTDLFNLTEAYDAITLWHVLEHLYDFHKYVAQFKRLLKPKGKLIIAVPNHSSADAQYYQSYWAAYDVPRHLWHFQPKDIDQLAKRHGMQVLSKYPMPLDAFYVSMLSEQYKGGSSLIGGSLRGFSSNMKSMANTDRCSSVIYVLSSE